MRPPVAAVVVVDSVVAVAAGVARRTACNFKSEHCLKALLLSQKERNPNVWRDVGKHNFAREQFICDFFKTE